MPDGPGATNDGHVPILAYGGIFLRPAERSDLPLFIRWLTDARTSRTLELIAPLSLAGEESWFDDLQKHHGEDRWHFVVCRTADERPVGIIDLHQVDLRNGNASVGIVIGDPADTGHGYGSDALRVLLAFGFGELRLERIWLDVFAFNQAARRMYERVGFVLEGTLRHAMFHEGTFHDDHRMAILREEWVARFGPKQD